MRRRDPPRSSRRTLRRRKTPAMTAQLPGDKEEKTRSHQELDNFTKLLKTCSAGGTSSLWRGGPLRLLHL